MNDTGRPFLHAQIVDLLRLGVRSQRVWEEWSLKGSRVFGTRGEGRQYDAYTYGARHQAAARDGRVRASR